MGGGTEEERSRDMLYAVVGVAILLGVSIAAMAVFLWTAGPEAFRELGPVPLLPLGVFVLGAGTRPLWPENRPAAFPVLLIALQLMSLLLVAIPLAAATAGALTERRRRRQ